MLMFVSAILVWANVRKYHGRLQPGEKGTGRTAFYGFPKAYYGDYNPFKYSEAYYKPWTKIYAEGIIADVLFALVVVGLSVVFFEYLIRRREARKP